MPLLSFGWALPVGVASLCEWFAVFLREELAPDELARRLGAVLPQGFKLGAVEELGPGKRVSQPVAEVFELRFLLEDPAPQIGQWLGFAAATEFPYLSQGKKGERQIDLRPLLSSLEMFDTNAFRLTFTWENGYLSPVRIVKAVCPGLGLENFSLLKTLQIFAPKA